MVFFDIPPLPSSSPIATDKSKSPPSNPTTTLTDPVCSLIKSSNYSFDVIDQTITIKTQPKTAQSKLTHAPMCHPKFMFVKHVLHVHHAPPPADTCQRSHRHAPTFFHAPHAPKSVLQVSPSVVSTRHHHDVSPSDISTMTLSDVDLWLWSPLLTEVKNFQLGLSCSVFHVDSDFGFCFFV